MSKEDIRELAEDNAIYEFNKFKKIYGNYTDEYVRHFYNKLAELRSEITDNHTCNCQHNSHSRDDEPCCRCQEDKCTCEDKTVIDGYMPTQDYYYCRGERFDRKKV